MASGSGAGSRGWTGTGAGTSSLAASKTAAAGAIAPGGTEARPWKRARRADRHAAVISAPSVPRLVRESAPGAPADRTPRSPDRDRDAAVASDADRVISDDG